MSVDEPPPASGTTRPELRKAWLSLALFLVALPLAFLVGEAVAAGLGIADGPTSPPLTAMLAVLAVAVAVLLLPLAVTVHFSRQAAAAGEPGVRAPVVGSVAVIGGFIALNVAALLFG